MIFIRYNNSELLHEVSFKRVSENIVSVIGYLEKNTSGFKTFSSSGEQLGDFSGYTTVYRTLDNEVQYSNDYRVYIEPEPFMPRELTADEIKQMLIDGVQNHLDEVAMSRGYDGILSVCSYFDSGVERFDYEGVQARKWRSQVWAYCYAYLDDVLAGNRPIPTLEELIEELPKIEW